MKFKFRHGLIWVATTLVYEGASVEIDNCILDTGSATTAIDIDLVAFNYRKPAIIRRLRGLGGGAQEVVCQRVDSLTLDGRELAPIDIEFGDIRPNMGINGFIGNDILSRFSLTIDFTEREVTLIPPSSMLSPRPL
jgi:hypothetical protein